MGRRYSYETTEKIALGIRGDRHSLCGAIKRYELYGKQRNGLLTLKERCARRIALYHHEQIKWFITSYLPPHLYKYVTKDIFNLRRNEFALNYPAPLYMCQECSTDNGEPSPDDCQCPDMDAAIKTLNKHFFKRMNPRHGKTKSKAKTKTNITTNANKFKKFELTYITREDDEMYFNYNRKKSASFFLHLSPVQYEDDIDLDENYGAFDTYHLINGRISAHDKLLFVDAMRFFGGFRTGYSEPHLLFNRCRAVIH